jgi:hypothetical protein
MRNPFMFATSNMNIIPEYHRTDNTNPPGFPPVQPKCGAYCIRSQCELINTENDETEMVFKGYDTDLDISERVTSYCERKRDAWRNNDKVTCTEPVISFIHNKNGCNGQIHVFDNKATTMWTIPGTGDLL